VRVRTLVVSFVVLLALVLAGGPLAFSQTVQGVITGTVTDPSGAAVPDATVTITNTGTGAAQTTKTNSSGEYRFSLVPPGNYIVDVKAANFAEVRASGIVVQASQTIPYDVKLELAKSSQTIEVNGQAPLVQTATSELALQVNRTEIENAPLVDRDVFGVLPFLAPQVSPGIDGMPTAGGSRESGTSYLMNGGEDNDNFSEGAINIRPPLDSIEDFSVITNSMSAQYGRGTGAVVSANQKSGSNGLHGSLYEFNRNALLNANNYFYDKQLIAQQSLPADQQVLTQRPKYIRNQFGGEVDGPIIKDKTFFSFAYDHINLLASTTNANTFVPTSAALAYLQANGGPLAQQVLKAFPPVTSDAPCPGIALTGAGTDYSGNGLPNPVGCLNFTDPETDSENTFYGRIDHNFSSKDRISFTVNLYRQNFVDKFGGGPLTTAGPINGTTTNHFHNLGLSESHVFNPRVVNEVNVTHNRHFNTFIEGNGTDTIPNIFIDNQTGGCLSFELGGPFEGGQVEGFVQDRWSVTDGLSWSIGRHSFKFGGGTQYGILYRNWDLGNPGQYEFGELITVNGTCPACSVVTPATDPNGSTLQSDGSIANVQDPTQANFAGDYPYFSETSIDPRSGAKGNAYRHYTYHDWNWFVQDDWKLSPKLTLNLGLRWDRYGAPSEDHGILAQAINTGCNILDPTCIGSIRVGPVSRMWPTQNHDFAPRIGFAWDPRGNGRMAIRGGYGIYYDRIFDNIWSNGAWNPPFYALADFDATNGDAIFYSNPASVGPAYASQLAADPTCQIPSPGVAGVCAAHRVSVRLMDQNMKDSSSMNYYLSVEHQFLGSFLARLGYQGAMGRHLPMLENYNRYDGDAYGKASPTSLNPVLPNPLYTGFNYRSNSVSSNYNSLLAELQKRFSNGLQFETGYTFSKLLDVNSELFQGCSSQSLTANNLPYYYITNGNPRLNYGRAGFDHTHSYKFSVTYELPFLKQEKGFVGHALGGWQVGSFFQYYSGHPIDVHIGRTRVAARMAPNGTTCTSVKGCRILDQNGIPFNIGGDYNLDGTANDHPNFVGSSLGSVYSGGSPADGIFVDNNRIGCGEAGVPNTVDFALSSSSCNISSPNTLFANPAYPGGATPFERFGNLGRDVFIGPSFIQLDMALNKNFKITEKLNLQFRAQAQNLLNHPSFDCVDAGLSDGTFGQALCLAQQTNNLAAGSLGAPTSRIMSLGLRITF
jgi:Carboxypeptidase regulatory-like domain/TonB dependent receptor